jgi:carbamoyltransferase
MKNYILGVNAYHGDSAACIINEDGLIAAAEEERFNRIKHWAGFPSESIKFCLEEAGITLEELSYVAINTDPKANFLKKIIYTIRAMPSPKLVISRVLNRKKRLSISDEINLLFPDQKFTGELKTINHHLCHLASAHLVSPFEDSTIISVDGFGDFSSGAIGQGIGKEITIHKNHLFPHSLGLFYEAFTQYLGFNNFGDEYKVMGLAPYGKPAFVDQLKDVVLVKQDGSYSLNLKYFRHHNEDIDLDWSGGTPTVGRLFKPENLEKLLGIPPRNKDEDLSSVHFDLARSVQETYEEAFFMLLNEAYKRYPNDAVTIAGGCGNNSVANGKIYRRTPFKKAYIAASAGDAGGAIGAAFFVQSQLEPSVKRFKMEHAYWGPSFTDDSIKLLLDKRMVELKEEDCLIEYYNSNQELCDQVAEYISNGEVIGWFQGKMEWGPRALGNRSILCDPRRKDMKDILNLKIKRRESFRPFAPSIQEEHVSDWFEEIDDVPFMMQVFQFKQEKRELLPAVVHVDGSGRLQTVSRRTNHKYHQLISSFHKLSGVPILLNTSFNENEPVVCLPDEALDCFLRTKMDVVVLGNYLIRRPQP